MRIVEIAIYPFTELSDQAKQRARDACRAQNQDSDWCEVTLMDFETVCTLMGIDLDKRTVRLYGGGTRQKAEIHYSGFGSQGDGASFCGTYRYRVGAGMAIRAHAPEDKELHRIADALAALQRRNFYALTATIRSHGRGCDEYAMRFDVRRFGADFPPLLAEDLDEILRDLARWLYRQLYSEWDYLNSDEHIDEMLIDGGSEFYETGAAA